MTQPEEAVTEQPESPVVVEDENKKMEEFFKTSDPRKTIYAKHDAIVAKEQEQEEPPPPEEPEPEVAKIPQEAPAEPAAESPKEPQEEAEEVIDRDEYERRTAKWKVKGKFFGEEEVIPAKEFIKTAGLEKKYQKRLAEVNQKERDLLDRQYQVPQAPIVPQQPIVPQGSPSPMHLLSDAQVRERYNELAIESPFDANAFLDQVRSARAQAQALSERSRAALAQKEFMGVYGYSEESPEWQHINDRSFYEKYHDVTRARDRGDYESMFTLAEAHRREEALSAREAAIQKDAEEERRKAQEKVDAKKKGQVLRVATKPETPKPKEEGFETPEEYTRRIASERRSRQGINRNFKT